MFLKAERKNMLVSPTEHVTIDKHVEMNEQLKPIGGGEQGERDEGGDEEGGLGRDVAMERQEEEGISAGSGGATGASAPRREKESRAGR